MATKMQLARDVNGLQKEAKPKVYSLSTKMKMSEMLLLEEMKSLVVISKMMLKIYKKFPSKPQTWRTC